jgi:hypothetical protein
LILSFIFTPAGATLAAPAGCVNLLQLLKNAQEKGAKIGGGPSEPSVIPFSPVDDIATRAKDSHILVLDSPMATSGSTVSQDISKNVRVIDHHAAYLNPSKPYQNTTSKIIDAYEQAEREMGAGASPVAVRDRMLKDLFNLDPNAPLPKDISVATDNLGDAALAHHLINNPQYLNNAELRRRFRLATFHEDFGVFGTRTIQNPSVKVQESVELSDAIMQVHDDIISQARADSTFAGAFKGSDRFNGIDAAAQKNIMQSSAAGIDRVLRDPAYRKAMAQTFRKNLTQASTVIGQKAVAKANSPLLQVTRSALSQQDFKNFMNQVSVVDGSKIPPGGQFSNWGAVAAAHSKNYQLQTIPMGGKTGYILSIPQGRTDLGIINEDLLKNLQAAGCKNFLMRDSGLLFNFAGDEVPLEKVIEIIARSFAK